MRDSLILKYGFKPSQYITGAGQLTHFKPTNQNRRMEEIKPTTTESNETKAAAHASLVNLNYSPEDMAGYMEWKKNDAIKRAKYMENTIDGVMAYVVSNRDMGDFQLPTANYMKKMTVEGGEDYDIYKIAASAIASQSQHQKEIERLTAERATLVKVQQEQAAAAAPTTATPESRRTSLAPSTTSLEALNAAIEASHAVVRKVYDANAPKLGGYLNDADATKTFAEKVDAVFQRMGVPKQAGA
jgi:IS1 family transposase